MYLRFYVYIVVEDFFNLIRGRKRQYTLEIPRLIAKQENKPVLSVWLRMLWSLALTGCTFKEYFNLDFAKRTVRNQRTFITTGSNMNAYSQLNDKAFYHIFLNKDEFNTRFADFIAREWIKLGENKELIYAFFSKHKDIIIKPVSGDSGRGIKIIHNSNELTCEEIDRIIAEHRSDIAEQVLYNHRKMNELNPLSLNTMRVITVRSKEHLDILFAGVRYGAKGCEIDNISTGGYIAPIDIATGAICGESHTKKTFATNNAKTESYVGFQIPMWDHLYDYLYSLTAVVPQMKYMAWDIAITNDGFVVIEGNHSSGNTVTQAHLSETQQGLKPRLRQIMKKINR